MNIRMFGDFKADEEKTRKKKKGKNICWII
jgi:hypothetical protein